MGWGECDQIILYKCMGLLNNLVENMKTHKVKRHIHTTWTRTEENMSGSRGTRTIKHTGPSSISLDYQTQKWANSITRIQRESSQHPLLEEHKK